MKFSLKMGPNSLNCLVTKLVREVTSLSSLTCPKIGKAPGGLGIAEKGFRALCTSFGPVVFRLKPPISRLIVIYECSYRASHDQKPRIRRTCFKYAYMNRPRRLCINLLHVYAHVLSMRR